MILERKTRFNIPDIKEEQGQFLGQLLNGVASDNPSEFIVELAELLQIYNAAMKGVCTKLEILDDEFSLTHKHNPIHYMECRVKSVASIYKKLHTYGVPVSLESAREHIQDIAGIRLVCNFVDDIFAIEQMLLKQPDVTLIKRKDYITNPKANGYRSLHLVVKIPVFLSERVDSIPVEIQMRTIAMDYWASLEHMLRYKNMNGKTQKYIDLLLECANTLADTEKTMQYIREKVEE